MNYLLLNGSTSKGNTWKLAEIARDEMEKQDEEAVFTEIHLDQLKLPFCTGCSNCFRSGEEKCPHKNQMKTILTAIEEADGIILASATFNMSMTGMLKNLLDHMAYMLHRPRFFTKKALILATTGGVGSKNNVKDVSGILRGIGFNRCYSVCAVTASWNAYRPPVKTVEHVRQAANRFCTDIKSRKVHYQNTDVLIPYNLFRGMSRYYEPGTEFATEDGVYWMREETKKRAYNAAVPLKIYQRLLGAVFYLTGRTAGKYMIVTYKK